MNRQKANIQIDEIVRGQTRKRRGRGGFWLGSTVGLCLLGWLVPFSAFLFIFFVQAVLFHQPAHYFTALLHLTWAYVACGYVLLEVCERLGLARQDSDARTKMVLLLGIGIAGMVLAGLLMFLLLMASGGWTSAGGMVRPGIGSGAGGQAPGAPQRPLVPAAFEPSKARPAHLHGAAPAVGKVPGLIAYWPFDEGEGKQAVDASGNGHHGTIHAAKWMARMSFSTMAPTQPSTSPPMARSASQAGFKPGPTLAQFSRNGTPRTAARILKFPSRVAALLPWFAKTVASSGRRLS
jgi:hypothetical protein